MKTLQEFWDILNGFDWFYSMSDDHGVWRAGQSAAERIKQVAAQSPEHQSLYEAFKKHIYGSETFGNPPHPKPERPQ